MSAHPPPSPGRNLGPEEIAGRVFPTVRRGFDPDAVRHFLADIAAYVRELRAEQGTLRAQSAPRAAPPPLDETALTKVLGEETTRVLQTARESAASIVQRAEHQAAELIAGAESISLGRRNEADAAARSTHERAIADAEGMIERTKQECRDMIEEARAARHQILADLADRRRTLLAQIEQARAGRETIATAIESAAAGVSRSLQSVRERLSGADDAARAAVEDVVDAGPDEGTIDDVIAKALSRLPSTAEPTVTPPEPSRVFDIEREEAQKAQIPATGAGVVSAEVTVTGPVRAPTGEPATDTPHDHGAARAPDRSPTVGEQEATNVTEPNVDGPARGQNPVDQLFAKIRAARESRVADAQRVLDAPSGKQDAGSEAASGAAHTEESSSNGASSNGASGDTTPGDEAVDGTAQVDAPGTERQESASPDDRSAERNAATAPIEVELARVLKRELREEQNELLDALRSQKKGSTPADLVPGDASRNRFATAVRPALAAAHAAGQEFVRASGRRGRAGSGDDASAVAHRLADEVVGALAERLAPALASGEPDGEAIGAAFRDWRSQRVDALASDFVVDAFSAGSLSTAKARKHALVWHFDDGGSSCPDCDDNAVAGPVAAGDAYPTGHTQPPVHPGCRCYLALA